MFQIIKQQDNLKLAISHLNKLRKYQALDIINNHIREVVETTKPNIENALRVINEYLDLLKESASMLESTTSDTERIKIEEAQQKIMNASNKLGALEECCKIMMRSKDKIE